jgi:hypothetical protein
MAAQAKIGQALPSNRCWAASFLPASRLVPGPQLEQVPSKFNLQTSQLIPHAPVDMKLPNFVFNNH